MVRNANDVFWPGKGSRLGLVRVGLLVWGGERPAELIPNLITGLCPPKHCTQYTEHCTLHTANRTPNTAQYTVYNVHLTLHTECSQMTNL